MPYQPFFLEQVEAGNVEAITSREDSIEGELRKPATYDPPGDDKPVEVDRFETQVPGFIDRAGQETLDQADAYRIARVEEPALEPEEDARAASSS